MEKAHDLIELLKGLAHQYRHIQQERDREGPAGATRRGLEVDMQRLGERFARLLSHWVEDEALREAWKAHLYESGPPPDEPRLASPPMFKGITQAGSRLELRATEDGGYDVILDGTVERHESVPWGLDPDLIEPIIIGEHTCREIFESPPEATRALVEFLATPGAEPPWRWLRALFEDGLVGADLALTPRGHRRLRKAGPGLEGAPPGLVFGIVAADRSRARLFLIRSSSGEAGPTLLPIVEVSQTTRPEDRARDSELFTDSRPGLRREGPHGPRHGVNDHRDAHRRDSERRFAQEIIKEAVRLFRAQGATRVILVAPAQMLGLLRPALARTNGGQKPWAVRELARDLTRLAPPALHDALAAAGLVPVRGRKPPVTAPPGIPI